MKTRKAAGPHDGLSLYRLNMPGFGKFYVLQDDRSGYYFQWAYQQKSTIDYVRRYIAYTPGHYAWGITFKSCHHIVRQRHV